jgi:Insertion element 4 transposase N-terminal
LEDQCVITREITVAAGVFAPGHLGELTQIVPFEMVDQALAATGTTQARLRVLPSRVVVYLLLAGCLLAELGYRQVWHKLTAGLGRLPVASPGDNALWQARARLGAAPLRWLFDLLCGPATAITAGSVRWCGLLVCAIDGTTMTVADSPRNLAAYDKQPGNHGGSGYPLLRLVALVACGTRTVIFAVFGPASCGELDYTRRLRRSLHAGMIVLLPSPPSGSGDLGRDSQAASRHRRQELDGDPRQPELGFGVESDTCMGEQRGWGTSVLGSAIPRALGRASRIKSAILRRQVERRRRTVASSTSSSLEVPES